MKKIFVLLQMVCANVILAQNSAPATAQGTTPQARGGMIGLLLPMVAIFAIWYFLLILPQQKKEKKRQEMLKAIKKGDRVITIGGIHGVVEKVDEQIVTLKLGGVLVDFSRSAIAQVGNSGENNSDKK